MSRIVSLKKIIFFIGLWLYFSSPLGAQQLLPVNEKTYADSLSHIIQSKTTDSIRANANLLLSDYWRAKDTLKSKSYLTAGKRLSAKYPVLKAAAYFYEGQYYSSLNPEKAKLLLQKATKALAVFKVPFSKEIEAAAWYNYAIAVRNEKGDSFLIKTLLEKSIPLATQSGKPEKTAHYYSQLGMLLMYNAQFDKAEIYFNKTIGLLATQHPKSTVLMLAYLGAASNYIYKANTDKAKIMLDKAKKILEPYPESSHYPNYYYTEGLYYTAKTYYNSALKSLDNGIRLAINNNQKVLLQMLIFRKYNIYLEQKEFKNAKQLLLSVLKEGTLAADVNNRKMFYTQLATVNEHLDDMGEAYLWQKKYSKLSDSLNESNLKERINEMEIRFHNAENQKKITALETEKKQVALSAKNHRLFSWLLAAISLFFLVIAMLSFAFYKNQKRLSRQKEINHLQQLKELKQQQLLSNTEAMLEGEERERRRLASDLHDGLGGMLAGVKIKLSGATAHKDRTPDPDELNKITGQLDNAVTELRRIARNMMPETLLRFGLQTALKDLCESLQTSSCTINYEAFNIDSNMPLSTQVIIYRIVQEALSNAIRHSEANVILVQCSQNGNLFFITVEDNGKGFDSSILEHKKGIGITNIENRIKYLSGKMEINTAPNEGTAINVELYV